MPEYQSLDQYVPQRRRSDGYLQLLIDERARSVSMNALIRLHAEALGHKNLDRNGE